MKHIKTINKQNLKETAAKGGCANVRLPASRLQDFLHGCKPEMRARKQIRLSRIKNVETRGSLRTVP